MLGEELPCLDEGSGIGVSIEKGRPGSSWEDCHRMCVELTNCSAWTFYKISPFSCDFFSKLETINAENLTLTGQINCKNTNAVVLDTGINARDFNNEEDKCIMKGVKIKGVTLGKERQSSK